MASNTPNINLLKKDPILDKLDTFNIQTMLNDNWDKIDASVFSKLGKTEKAADSNRLNGQLASYYTDIAARLGFTPQASGTYNTIIGTDTDLNTSGGNIIGYITVTDGVITAMGTRVLTPADIGTRKITSGTANPSGGVSGDVYLQYE